MPETTHHVTIRHVGRYQFTAEFPGSDRFSSLTFDEAPPLGEGRGPDAAAVLGAAVANCLAATLVNCLQRAHAPFDGLTAHVASHVSRNAQGRYRVSAIDVELEASVLAGDRAAVERCSRVFDAYCTVTESVRQGIPVNVAIRATASEHDPSADRAVKQSPGSGPDRRRT